MRVQMKPILAVISFVLGVSVAIGSSALAEDVALSGSQIMAEFSGATVRGKTAAGDPFTVTYSPGGSMSGKSGKYKDNGEWVVEGDKLCRQWYSWDNASRKCLGITKDGNEYRSYIGDTVRAVFQMK